MWVERTVATAHPDTQLPSVKPSGHVPALDGIRALAVSAVLFYHAGFTSFPGGFMGVDVFFALSGFLIGGILVRTLTAADRGAAGLPDFWLRRARRLFPALFVVVLAVVTYRFVFTYGEVAATWRTDILAAIAYATNWLQIALGEDYFTQWLDPSPMLQTWSLSIEEQFYIVFPLLLLVLVWFRFKGKNLALVLACAGIASAVWMAHLSHAGAPVERLYYGTDTRAQALLVGAAVGALIPSLSRYRAGLRDSWTRVVVGWLGLAGVLCLIAMMHADSQLLYRGGFLLVAVATLALIWGALGTEAFGVNRLLSLGPLVFIGMISYGIYLWHWPVFLLLRGDPGGGVSTGTQALRFILTFLIALTSYFVIERPVRSPRFTSWPVVRQWSILAVAACALILLAVVPTGRGMWLSDRLPGVWPAAEYVPRSLFVGGDSASLVLAMHFPRDRYPGTSVMYSQTLGCGLGTTRFHRGGESVDNTSKCSDWQQQWRDRMVGQIPDRSVVMMSIWDLFDREVEGKAYGPGTQPFRQSLADGVRKAIRTAGSDGATTVDVWGFPCYHTVLPQQAYLNDRSRVDEANRIVQQVTDEFPNARWVDFRPLTCSGDGSVEDVSGQSIRQDGIHWTEFGSAYVWQEVLGKLAEPPGPARGPAASGGSRSSR